MALTTVIVRALVLYATILVTFRLMGKRSMAELTPTDKTVGIVIGTIGGSVTITAKDPLWAGILGIALFSFVGWILGRLSREVPIIRAWVQGRSRLVMRDGQPIAQALAQTGLAREDLDMRLREAKVKAQDVSEAFMETDGHLGIVKKAKGTPASPS
jgi:uncharacterized membrane protein YcaP (DUF421 family)